MSGTGFILHGSLMTACLDVPRRLRAGLIILVSREYIVQVGFGLTI
jgi:hypothetical protein